MLPTDNCFLTLRRRALAPRSFPHAFQRTEPLTFSRRHWRFGGPPGECAGSSLPLLASSYRDAASHDDRASDTPVTSLDSNRSACTPFSRPVEGCQDRFRRLRVKRRRLSRPEVPSTVRQPSVFPSGPRFRDGRGRPAPGRSHDFAAVARRLNAAFSHVRFPKAPSPLRELSPEETAALREVFASVSPRCSFPAG